MKALKAVGVVALVGIAFAGGYVVRETRSGTITVDGRKVLYYVDPMHPAYRSDRPGVAPDCGMTLEPVYEDDLAPDRAPRATNRRILHYRDPADPNYTSPKPGLNPETGNTLEPIYAEPTSGSRPGTVHIPPERQQLIGVKFATAEWNDSARTIRTVGKVAYDETRIAHVHTRVDGWAEKVFVDFTGDFVKKGQPMLTIYSPELLASQQELLLAARARGLMASNPLASAAQGGESLFEAAKRRLELWDLSAEQIERVLETGQPVRSITLHAPASGFVLERQVFPNQKITPESDLYTLVDLSRVWIMADVFESDIAAIRPGDRAHVSFPYAGAAPLTARVMYIQPQVDAATRTLKVRLEVANPGIRLKPDMFVNVELGVAGTRVLSVPADAVVDTGERQTVFVDLGDGYLEPRAVKAGERMNGRITILEGLSAGDRVVSSGTFLVDSESQLRSATSAMGRPQIPQGAAKPADNRKAPGAPPHD